MRNWAAAAAVVLAIIMPGLAFGDVYYWVDEQGVQYYTTRPESIPEAYRSAAESLAMPESPPAPPELEPDLPKPKKGVTKIPFAPGSPILVSVKINGSGPVTLVLDTGADRTLVSPWVLAQLGVSAEGVLSGILKGVTGITRTEAVWVSSVEVGDAKVGPLLVIAHDAGLKGADGLLGRDFLANFNVTIDSKAKIVTLTTE
ncbi:MAG: retroviral-like aspartic protease family protein [Syntrophales bacterium LBB04]|nr:retroviral-like aspartic protease family protein [Syntrophales bacterium LBB04]